LAETPQLSCTSHGQQHTLCLTATRQLFSSLLRTAAGGNLFKNGSIVDHQSFFKNGCIVDHQSFCFCEIQGTWFASAFD